MRYYRELLPRTTVDWFAFHQGEFQLDIGCQSTVFGQGTCDLIVRSLLVR